MRMSEAEWVELMAGHIQRRIRKQLDNIRVEVGLRIAYGHEISSYGPASPAAKTTSFKTDLVLVEDINEETWRPRVVVEAKVNSVTTHSAITYSQKAAAHRAVHPYLRYGIMLGNRKESPLPGRLYRHGAQFDFMISFRSYEPLRNELSAFMEILVLEVEASRTLEKILYESRMAKRDRFSVLHRRLDIRPLRPVS